MTRITTRQWRRGGGALVIGLLTILLIRAATHGPLIQHVLDVLGRGQREQRERKQALSKLLAKPDELKNVRKALVESQAVERSLQAIEKASTQKPPADLPPPHGGPLGHASQDPATPPRTGSGR